MRRRSMIVGSGLSIVAAASRAQPAAGPPLRIGVLTDMTTQYSDLNGRGAVVAAQMAAEDFGGPVLGRKLEILSADMQGKVDVGLALARNWYDSNGVDAIIDIPNSGLALAVQDLAQQKGRAMIATASSSDITGVRCVPNGLQWGGTSYSLGAAPAREVLAAGGKTWFFITVDYAFGQALERDTAAVVQSDGGRVVGAVRHPFDTTDFSSYLLQAQSSGASVIAFANTGDNLNNSLKQAAEFGLSASGKTLVGLAQTVTNLHAIGLESAGGMVFTSPWYWDATDATRTFARRWGERVGGGRKPDRLHVANYSIVSQYLKAAIAANSTEPPAVLAAMRSMPVNDIYTQSGQVLANGALSFDWFVLKAKQPNASRGEWDLAEVVRSVPASQAIQAAEASGCRPAR